MINRFEPFDPDDVDERGPDECAEAWLAAHVREQMIELCYGAYLLGAEDEHRSLIGTLLNEGFTRRQVAGSIIRLREAA